jgi:uncharacterized membrane protein
MTAQTVFTIIGGASVACGAVGLRLAVREKNRVLMLMALSVIIGPGAGLLRGRVPMAVSIGISLASFVLSICAIALLWRTTRERDRVRWEAARRAADLPPMS